MKRHIKQFLAVMLALLMLASMSLVAFAAPDDADDHQSFTVTFNAGEGTFSGGGNTKTATASYDEDYEEYLVTAPTETPILTGSDFQGWSNGSNTCQPGDKEVRVAKEAATFNAVWEQDGETPGDSKDYQITFKANGGTFPNGKSEMEVIAIWDEDEEYWTFTPPAAPTQPADKGSFVEWTGGGDKCVPGYGDKVIETKITEFTAQWEDKAGTTTEHNITYVTGHGTAPADGTTVGGKLPAKLPELTFDGYTFKGWFVGDKRYTGGETVTADIELTAKWEVKTSQPNSGSTPSTPSYTVTDGEGDTDEGSWSSDKTSAKAGDTVTVTVTPKDGFDVASVAVKDASGEDVEVTDNGDGTYSYVMPAGGVSVSVTFAAKPAVNPFTDVDPEKDRSYYDAILWAVENGITQGSNAEGTTFAPGKDCTRAQNVTFLWRAFGKPDPTSAENPFSDVDQGSYYDAILWANENGITSGVGDGTAFAPGNPCTRAQFVTFLWRACGKQEPTSTENPFTDVDAEKYAPYYKAILWAVENGITTGTGDGTTFAPDRTCTRAQVVTFLYRAVEEAKVIPAQD